MTFRRERLSDFIELIEGDSSLVLEELDASEFDCCLTDPPYEITASGGGIGRSRRDLQETEGFTDCGFDYRILDRFDNWMCFGTLRQVPKLIENAVDRRWMLITWNKPNPCPLINGNYLPDTEYIIHAWRKDGLHGDFYDKARFIVHRLGDKEDGQHPNEKPMTVMRKLVRTAAGEGQRLIDLYAGSGTTGIAAAMEGRHCLIIEKSPEYCRVIRERVKRFEGMAPGSFLNLSPVESDLFAEGERG